MITRETLSAVVADVNSSHQERRDAELVLRYMEQVGVESARFIGPVGDTGLISGDLVAIRKGTPVF